MFFCWAKLVCMGSNTLIVYRCCMKQGKKKKRKHPTAPCYLALERVLSLETAYTSEGPRRLHFCAQHRSGGWASVVEGRSDAGPSILREDRSRFRNDINDQTSLLHRIADIKVTVRKSTTIAMRIKYLDQGREMLLQYKFEGISCAKCLLFQMTSTHTRPSCLCERHWQHLKYN